MLSDHFHKLHLAWKLMFGASAWFVIIGFSHLYLNFERETRRVVSLGYMPVVTNLAAPLLDAASKTTNDGVRFRAQKFASFAELGEAIRNNQIDAAFMIAPLSIVLRQQGEDVKIVYIGNRHESTLVARKDLNVHTVDDLIGMTVAVPMRYSGHYLSIKHILKQRGIEDLVKVVEMNPPDMASALAAGALEAYYVGEPFAAKTLQSGDSALVHYVEEVWEGFICNLVVVRNELIENDPAIVSTLVHSAIRSGKWADQYPEKAIEIAATYWNQSQGLVKFALTTPDHRIVYDAYQPKENEMQFMADMMVDTGLIENNNINGLVDDRFTTDVRLDHISADISSILSN